MDFFFVRDHRQRPRFFSAEPLGPLPAHFSKTRAVWEKAKKKVTGLNPRTLLQEQAFEHGGHPGHGPAPHPPLRASRRQDPSGRGSSSSSGASEDPPHLRPRRRGPRRPLHRPDRPPARPEHRLLRPGHPDDHPMAGRSAASAACSAASYEFVADPLLAEWEAAVEARDEARYPGILGAPRKDPRPPLPRKLLWK
ncbi:MAG: hypothetical protein MZW92_61370 [Comamonadaceae bacterium]|nr:hypothetical protein [Comamonadaceae bacterium]